MTQVAMGKGGQSAFQVSVSTLTLGTLYEAILSFSNQESLDRFWPAVCQNARWLIPSRRMCILMHKGGDIDVTSAFERGRVAAGVGDVDESDEFGEALQKANTQWFTDPAGQFTPVDGSLTGWLLEGTPETLFVLPLLSGRRVIGCMLFVMGAIDEGDKAMLNTLGTIYALHVSMTYTLIEITQQQRQMQQQLVMKEKMASLGNLVAGVLHEMNTPAGAISSAADVTGRAVQRAETEVAAAESIEALRSGVFQRTMKILRDNGRVIVDASARITGLMSRLRSFVRLDEAEFQVANVEEGIDSALALLESEFGAKVRVEKNFGGLQSTFCSPGQLNQAFMNVLQNAVQAVRGDGVIRLRTWQEAQQLHVEIEDTGVGIDADQLRQIFEVTFRNQESRVRMGSGLSVAYHIINEHGGDIRVDSQIGQGTCVHIELPVRSEADAPEQSMNN